MSQHTHPKQAEVVALLLQGHSYKEIQHQLQIPSPTTITRIKKRLGFYTKPKVAPPRDRPVYGTYDYPPRTPGKQPKPECITQYHDIVKEAMHWAIKQIDVFTSFDLMDAVARPMGIKATPRIISFVMSRLAQLNIIKHARYKNQGRTSLWVTVNNNTNSISLP